MTTDTWGWDIFEQDELVTGCGRLTVGKGRNGPNGNLTLTLAARRVFQLQKLLESLAASEGTYAEKRALILILEDLRLAIAEERRRLSRMELLRKAGAKVWRGSE